MKPIYLDNNATTPVKPEVLEKVMPFLTEHFGNPSSAHWAGRAAKDAVDEARGQIADLLKCKSREIIFTSGGSESDNFAIKGTYFSRQKKVNHIITTAVEHPAVLSTCKYMERIGSQVTYLPVDKKGRLDLDDLKRAITSETVLISIIFANNETGVLSPIEEIGKIAKQRGILFHTDAVQAIGRIPIDVEQMNIDILSLSGHKLGAVKGIGAIYVRHGTKLFNLIHGGHQELGRRAGTENVPGIVALGEACRLAGKNFFGENQRLAALRDRLEQGILERIPEVIVNGDPKIRLPNTLNISFRFIEGEGILLLLDMKGIAASSGSACTSGTLDPSHVLLAMAVKHEDAHGSVRFSLGSGNSQEDIEHVLDTLPAVIEKLRVLSPLWNHK